MPKRKKSQPEQNKQELKIKQEKEEEDKNQQQQSEEKPSAFELWRQSVIQRNRERLEALGISMALEDLRNEVEIQSQKNKKRKLNKSKESVKPSRTSKRLSNQKEQKEAEEEKLNLELGRFIVDGVCPRCRKVVTKGHKSHLQSCSGVVREPKQLTVQQMIEYEEVEKRRLRDLELGGLVDINHIATVFMVIGSTGNHYLVRFLNSGERKCQCPDHRIRKRDCKHIQLLLADLEVEEQPSKWKEALEKKMRDQCEKYQLTESS
eukprot:TRINITY_DN6310_c0_g1_i1.p1 TRINITY_DN6310_c0_g1~~TRINITY_DN6310_c0_g1_i1.p1  ORF type:complete len:297 (+),score=31.38 TRINITY_DN6310_c0_g1_i1:105-893(+)